MIKRTIAICVFLLAVAYSFGQTARPSVTLKADSLFMAGSWNMAATEYESKVKANEECAKNPLVWCRLGFSYFNLDNYEKANTCYVKSEDLKPSASIQPVLYSRMARLYAVKEDKTKMLEYLGKAQSSGYILFDELDTLKEFKLFKSNEDFKKIRNKIYNAAYPCMADQQSRQFDFWVGEWDAYVTGTNVLGGHSIIQMASGGCMILENWTSARYPYSGKSMNFVDNVSHKWEQVWVGSEGGGQHMFTNGIYYDSAMRFDFEDTAKGKKIIGRFTFFNQGANQVRQLNETSEDGGKTWVTAYDLTYKRRKKE